MDMVTVKQAPARSISTVILPNQLLSKLKGQDQGPTSSTSREFPIITFGLNENNCPTFSVHSASQSKSGSDMKQPSLSFKSYSSSNSNSLFVTLENKFQKISTRIQTTFFIAGETEL